MAKRPRKAKLLSDQYPTHYLPNVGRQVMADGGVPEDTQRAHEFVQEELNRDLYRPSPVVEKYAAPSAAQALEINRDRPAASASEFVRHQLSKDEPQLPQYDRENVQAWKEGAKELGHLAAYGIPYVGEGLMAYDLANAARSLARPGASSQDRAIDLVNAGLAFPGMGRAAKAAAVAGAALAPEEAQAGTINKILNSIRKYPIAPRSRWYGEANYQQTGGKMTSMSPDDFLSQARPLKMDELTRENIDDLKAHILGGGELDPLQLYEKGLEDGRHRAHAAKELGIVEVPVINFRTKQGDVEGYDKGGAIAKVLGKMMAPGSGYAPRKGFPELVNLPGIGKVESRPIPEIESIARRFAGEAHDADVTPLNPEFSKRVAQEYDVMRHDPQDPIVRRAFQALADETMQQYRAAKDLGLDIKFLKPGQADPYAASPALGYEDIVNRGRLFVYPTEAGFGSTGGINASNVLLKGAGRVGDKEDAVVNDAFRVIHDLFGHFGPGNAFFRAPGEERAFQLHKRMFSPEARPALTSETRGQNSWVNFGEMAERNRAAKGADTYYADQKTGLMPDWTMANPPAEGANVDEYIRSLPHKADGGIISKALNAIRAYHGSPYKFDRFDISKIGTGEGAQAYGHGLYFAENPEVAHAYREALSPYGRGDRPEDIAARVLHATRGDRDAALAELRNRADTSLQAGGSYEGAQRLMEARNIVNTNPEVAGHIYEVDIRANPERLLDWDKSISNQRNILDTIIHKYGGQQSVLDKAREFEDLSARLVDAQKAPRTPINFVDKNNKYLELQSAWDAMHKDPTQRLGSLLEEINKGTNSFGYNPADKIKGSDFYRAINPSKIEATKTLSEAGIPGIRYLDQGSRGAGSGSRNYVMFDPNLIDITRRYSKGGDVEGYDKGGAILKALQIARQHIQPAERMMVSHGIDEGNLRRVAELGAFPAPSLAIHKPMWNVPSFGTIKLIGKPEEFVAPSELNPVFGRDAYTPRVPERIKYYPRLSNKLMDFSEEELEAAKALDQNHMFEKYIKGSTETEKVPFNVENIVEHIKAQPLIGGEEYTPMWGRANAGEGPIAAARLAPKISTLEDVLAARSRLSAPDAGERARRANASHEEMSSLMWPYREKNYESLMPAREPMSGLNFFTQALEENRVPEFYPEAPKHFLEEAAKHREEMVNLPSPYLEVKPLRRVEYKDFAGALVPDIIEKEAAPALEKMGIPYKTYEGDAWGSEIGPKMMEHYGEHSFADGGTVNRIPRADDEQFFRRLALWTYSVSPLFSNTHQLSQNRLGYDKGGVIAKAIKAASNLAKEEMAAPAIVRPLDELFPGASKRYAVPGEPVPAIDKVTGKPYLEKTLSPEGELVLKARKAAQKAINKGDFKPFFDPRERFDVDVGNYAPYQSTLDIRRVQPATQEKYDALARSPVALERLGAAYQQGLGQAADAGNWYHMGQLEKQFVDAYGPERGRDLFKERFADAMAATTGGADPTTNLMMAHYGNYLKNRGETIPEATYNFPFPIGGRFAGSNMDQYRKMILEGQGIGHDNPKRYNFAYNFLGEPRGATLDEQMSNIFDPKMNMPPTGTYGHYEGALHDIARKYGVDPRYFQEVAWAGGKDLKAIEKNKPRYKAQPMIQNVNEAIERTSRITGLSPAAVVERGLVRAEMPLYQDGGAVIDRALDVVSKLPHARA